LPGQPSACAYSSLAILASVKLQPDAVVITARLRAMALAAFMGAAPVTHLAHGGGHE
jgi:hypothetical protein